MIHFTLCLPNTKINQLLQTYPVFVMGQPDFTKEIFKSCFCFKNYFQFLMVKIDHLDVIIYLYFLLSIFIMLAELTQTKIYYAYK